jgi:hypothetical protein
MRRVFLPILAVSALALTTIAPSVASAQVTPGQQRQQELDMQRMAPTGPAALDRRANAGPCPYVKILYDAARYVEMTGDQVSAGNVGFTGEIEGLSADCRYRDDQPITVDINLLFRLGRGPQASGDTRTYRYWVAVTERNSAILAKEYFDFSVDFAGSDRADVEEQIRGLTIPRAGPTVSGGNFEILIGFDVTPEMAEFNRSGSRFRINAGQSQTPTQ